MKLTRILIALIAGVFILNTPVYADDSNAPGPVLKINRSKGDKCVEPTKDMRKNHMKYLLHQRDETMHKGIRTKKHSLKECVSCHANKDDKGNYIPVNAKGEFCQSCHSYASVKLDCFECHATKPRQVAFHPIVNKKMQAFADIHTRNASSNLLNKIATTDNSLMDNAK